MTKIPAKILTLVLAATLLIPSSGCCFSIPKPALAWSPMSFGYTRSLAIPEVYPVGSVVRAHYHQMETNGEATDFVINRHEFVGSTAELTPRGKDHIMEVAARMRSAPFPVIVERSINNSDPELDQHRRNLVAQILTDFGNQDAAQRTVVAPAYGRGISSNEAMRDYYRFVGVGGIGGFGQFGGNVGQYGGFGAGGGIGFGP